MIKKKRQRDGFVQVTFALPDGGEPVSVVADVNGWDPHAHPLKKRSNGTRSVSMTVPEGSAIRFRYLDGNGMFFDDPEGDSVEPNGYGDTHTVLAV
jgi:1,4-alpha-glucan branching enzyme